ncbi:Replication factor A protein 2 [Microbotryomycetes sp. JL221]|nr:Replication factor A protein 2 [Microbotryomycetes sp. JL221]
MSYGAGGGWMANGSQDSPGGGGGGGGKSRGPQSLRPVTIFQINNAEQAHPDADFTIDGAEIKDVTFVACVRNKDPSTTNIAFVVEDGTGQIDARQWIHATDEQDTQFSDIDINTYVRILGTVKSFGNKRSINCNRIRAITDMNEINFHMVEVAYVSTYYKNGGNIGSGIDMNGVVSNVGGNNANNPYAAGGDGDGGADDFAGYASVPRRLMRYVAEQAKTHGGLPNYQGSHISHIQRNALPDMDLDQVRAEVTALVDEGALFTTIDDDQ